MEVIINGKKHLQIVEVDTGQFSAKHKKWGIDILQESQARLITELMVLQQT